MAIPKVNLRKITRQGGTSYMLDYAVNGRRYRECVGNNKRDAEIIRSKKQSELALGKFQIPKQRNLIISIQGLIDAFTASKTHNIRPTSLHRYKNYLSRFQSYFEEYFPAVSSNIKILQDSYIQEFLYQIQDKTKGKTDKVWSKKTINGMLGAAKQLFNFAVEQQYIDSNPFQRIKPYKLVTKGKVEFFTEEELESIWKIIDPYWVAPLNFIVHTGLRKGELINLKWKYVTLNGNKSHITVTSDEDWSTKTGASRVIPLNETAIDILNQAKGKNATYVFISKTGLRIHPDQPLRALKKALEELKLSGDVHKFRHTFASNLVMKGVDLYTVSKLLGHSDVKMTQIYAHLSPDHLKDSVTKLDKGDVKHKSGDFK